MEKLLHDSFYTPTIKDRIEVIKYFFHQDYSFLLPILENIVSLLRVKAEIVFEMPLTLVDYSLESMTRISYNIQNKITTALERALKEENQLIIDVLKPVALFEIDFEGVAETLLDAGGVPQEVKDEVLFSYNENFLQKFNRFYADFDDDSVASRAANIYESLGYIDNELFFFPMGAEFPHERFLDEFKRQAQKTDAILDLIININKLLGNILFELERLEVRHFYQSLREGAVIQIQPTDDLAKMEYILRELDEMEKTLSLFYKDVYSAFLKKIEDRNYNKLYAIDQIKFLSKAQIEELLGLLKNNFPESLDANAKLLIKKLTFQYIHLEDTSLDKVGLEREWQTIEKKENFQYLDVESFIKICLAEVDELLMGGKDASVDAAMPNFEIGSFVSQPLILMQMIGGRVMPQVVSLVDSKNLKLLGLVMQPDAERVGTVVRTIVVYNESPKFTISDLSYAIAGNIVGSGVVNPAIECFKDKKFYDSWWECFSSNFDSKNIADAAAPTAISVINQVVYPSSIPLITIFNSNLWVEMFRYYNDGEIPSILNAGISTIFTVVSNIGLNIALSVNKDVFELHKDHPFTSSLLLTVMMKQGIALPGYIYHECINNYNNLKPFGEVQIHEEL